MNELPKKCQLCINPILQITKRKCNIIRCDILKIQFGFPKHESAFFRK